MSRVRFLADLQKLQKLTLDTSVLIYHLEDVAPYSELTEAALNLIAEGKLRAKLPTIAVAELLVKPFLLGADRMEACERFLLSLPHTDFVAPDYAIAREAARLRAAFRLRTPDALLLATAVAQESALLSNDRALKKLRPRPAPVVILDDYV